MRGLDLDQRQKTREQDGAQPNPLSNSPQMILARQFGQDQEY